MVTKLYVPEKLFFNYSLLSYDFVMSINSIDLMISKFVIVFASLEAG